MVKTIIARILPDRSERSENKVELIKTCPHCGVTVVGTFFDAYRHQEKDFSGFTSDVVYLLHYCERCERVFLVRYLRRGINGVFEVGQVFPNPTKGKIFEPYTNEVSPRFVKIYNQSVTAESNNLDEIAGMGYRKALECLVKDYLIGVKKIDRETIENMPLAQCITQYVKNETLSMLMTKSTWLGNDFAHYVCKHDEGIDTLKKMLDATVYWISMEKIAADAAQIERK